MCLVCLCVAAGVHTKDIPDDIHKTLQSTLEQGPKRSQPTRQWPMVSDFVAVFACCASQTKHMAVFCWLAHRAKV